MATMCWSTLDLVGTDTFILHPQYSAGVTEQGVFTSSTASTSFWVEAAQVASAGWFWRMEKYQDHHPPLYSFCHVRVCVTRCGHPAFRCTDMTIHKFIVRRKQMWWSVK